MNKKNDLQIENLDTWDVNQADVRSPVKSSRTVVSVSFGREDFDRVSKYAESIGKRTSQFIRDAAIENTLKTQDFVFISSFSGGLGTFLSTAQIPTVSKVSGLQIDIDDVPDTLHATIQNI